MMLFRRFIAALAALAISATGALAQGASFSAGSVWGNDTAAARPGKVVTITSILDRALGSTRGSIIERGASGWAIIGPGSVGLPWVSAGAGADPLYQMLGVLGGGTGINVYAIGDIICASGITALSKISDVATGNALISGGVGACPSYGKITSSHLNVTATTCSNQVITAISTSVAGTCSALTLASAQFANQGTTTTVLHGNAAGNPSFGAVVSADLNITTTSCVNQYITAISAGGIGTCTGITLAGATFANQGTTTTVLHGNAGGNPSFGPIALATDVSGTLQAAQFPALAGDCTTSAGSLATTCTKINGVDQTTAWTTYTPTVTCGGGPPTTFSVAGSSSKAIGKTIAITINLVITTIGPCAAPLTFSLPVAPLTNGFLVGGENQSTGKVVKVPLNAASTTTGGLTNYDNTSPLASNTTFILTGVYQAQ